MFDKGLCLTVIAFSADLPDQPVMIITGIKYFFFEIDDSYAEDLLETYKQEGLQYSLELKEDLSGKKRFLVGKL